MFMLIQLKYLLQLFLESFAFNYTNIRWNSVTKFYVNYVSDDQVLCLDQSWTE